jgi:hypothetical protein
MGIFFKMDLSQEAKTCTTGIFLREWPLILVLETVKAVNDLCAIIFQREQEVEDKKKEGKICVITRSRDIN